MPLGSILVALLFIRYINDMPNILKKCEIILYAADTLIFTEEESEQICYNNLENKNMNNVSIWLEINTYIHIYIIGNYKHSVRFIDL